MTELSTVEVALPTLTVLVPVEAVNVTVTFEIILVPETVPVMFVAVISEEDKMAV